MLLARCTQEWSGAQRGRWPMHGGAEILQTVERLAAEALRTLGVAFRPTEPATSRRG